MRSPRITRLYLQCRPDEDIGDWSDDRIWSELHTRLACSDGWRPAEGRILQKGVTGMRSFVVEPLQYQRLFLAGDAAHIVPPTGAKGMNLAFADVHYLSEALDAFYRSNDAGKLVCYSQTCLRRIWKAQRFSWWMTSLLHRFHDESAFDHRRQQAEPNTSPARGRPPPALPRITSDFRSMKGKSPASMDETPPRQSQDGARIVSLLRGIPADVVHDQGTRIRQPAGRAAERAPHGHVQDGEDVLVERPRISRRKTAGRDGEERRRCVVHEELHLVLRPHDPVGVKCGVVGLAAGEGEARPDARAARLRGVRWSSCCLRPRTVIHLRRPEFHDVGFATRGPAGGPDVAAQRPERGPQSLVGGIGRLNAGLESHR